jgi:hypothetical protein
MGFDRRGQAAGEVGGERARLEVLVLEFDDFVVKGEPHQDRSTAYFDRDLA